MPQSEAPIANFLTFDVEEYYHVNYAGFDPRGRENEKTGLPRLVDRLVEMCSQAGVHCTFFVLGVVAEKYPQVVSRIHSAGHEVASHGYCHIGIREMDAAEFGEDVRRSCGILESVTGAKVQGFRAPSFSVDEPMLPWFYEILEGCGLSYSSSIFPGKTFLYGVPGFPRHPHRPSCGGRATSIVEFPITGFDLFGRRLPLYFRLLPAGVLYSRMHSENKHGRPAVVYVHPREIDLAQPILPLSRGQRFIHYWGLRGAEAKLRWLLGRTDLRFSTMLSFISNAAEQGAAGLKCR